MNNTTVTNPYERRRKALKDDFRSWRSHYRDIQANILPRSGRFLSDESGKTTTNWGGEINDALTHTHPILCVERCTSGLFTGATSAARPWMRLEIADEDLMQYGPVKEWLFKVRNLLLKIFARSNFYNQTKAYYSELVLYGTAAMMLEPDFENVVRFKTFTAGEYLLAQDWYGKVDTFYRRCWMTAAQMRDKFGEDAVSDAVKLALKNHKPDDRFEVVQAIQRRSTYDPDKRNNRNMPWSSVHYEPKRQGDAYLRESGYEDFPVMACRWHLLGDDVYGRSPAMDALPDIKMLHELETDSLRIIETEADPPLVAGANLQNKVIDSLPGGVTYTTGQGTDDTVSSLFSKTSNPQPIEYKIERVEKRVERLLHNDLFAQFINDDRPERTAYEAARRYEEKLQQLGPVFERIQNEFLDPVINKVYQLAEDAGILPEPPRELDGVEFTIKYISTLAQAQRMAEVQAIEQTVALTGNLVGIYPEARHKLDPLEVQEQFGEIVGLPPNILRPNDEVRKLVAAEQQQQAAAQAMEQMSQGAAQAKLLSETNVGEQSMLEQLMGGVQ